MSKMQDELIKAIRHWWAVRAVFRAYARITRAWVRAYVPKQKEYIERDSLGLAAVNLLQSYSIEERFQILETVATQRGECAFYTYGIAKKVLPEKELDKFFWLAMDRDANSSCYSPNIYAVIDIGMPRFGYKLVIDKIFDFYSEENNCIYYAIYKFYSEMDKSGVTLDNPNECFWYLTHRIREEKRHGRLPKHEDWTLSPVIGAL